MSAKSLSTWCKWEATPHSRALRTNLFVRGEGDPKGNELTDASAAAACCNNEIGIELPVI